MTQNGKTRDRIFDCATRLFAVKGYDAVSVKDIAQGVGIKPASLYNYFPSKESILDEILTEFEKCYVAYFEALTDEIETLTNVKEIVDAIFEPYKNAENELMHYGLIIALKHQFYNERAKNVAFSLLYTYSIDKIKSYIDSLIEKKAVPPCNSKSIATFLMLSVFSGMEFQPHNTKAESELPLDIGSIYEDLNSFIYDSICG